MAVQLFPADGVVWVIATPSGVATETIWPDWEWIEALAFGASPVPVTTEEWEEVRAA